MRKYGLPIFLIAPVLAIAAVTYPSMDVLKLNRSMETLKEHLGQTLSATNKTQACFSLGKALSEKQNALDTGARINDLMLGAVSKGDEPPKWLSDLSIQTNKIVQISNDIEIASKACSKRSASLDRETIQKAEANTNQLLKKLAPFIKRAIRKI